MTSKSQPEKYQTAIALLTAESGVFWSLTQTFLLAETLLAGFLLQSSSGPSVLPVAGATLGVLTSILWILGTLRIGGYCDVRVRQAKALEDTDGLLTTTNVTKGMSTKKSALVLASSFFVFFVGVLAWILLR